MSSVLIPGNRVSLGPGWPTDTANTQGSIHEDGALKDPMNPAALVHNKWGDWGCR